MGDEYITLARVWKTQGRHGEVAVEVHSDVPDRFTQGMLLWALSETGTRRELRVESLWPHKGSLILKFSGVNSISEAELLAGCELQVPVEQRARLDSGWAYVSDLVGCAVFDKDRQIGTVENVNFGAGEAPLLVVSGDARQYEIPYAEAYLKRIDFAHKRIDMFLPEGMLEVNDPLSREEKQRQAMVRKK